MFCLLADAHQRTSTLSTSRIGTLKLLRIIRYLDLSTVSKHQTVSSSYACTFSLINKCSGSTHFIILWFGRKYESLCVTGHLGMFEIYGAHGLFQKRKEKKKKTIYEQSVKGTKVSIYKIYRIRIAT